MKFPVGDVVGLDRQSRLVFGCIVLLEVETYPSVLGPDVETVFHKVQRSRSGPVDRRAVFDTVLKGVNVRIVHFRAFSLLIRHRRLSSPNWAHAIFHIRNGVEATGVAEGPGHQVKVIGKKVVGVLDFDSVGRDRGLRKVLRVARDDHVAAACYRRGENMTVVGVLAVGAALVGAALRLHLRLRRQLAPRRDRRGSSRRRPGQGISGLCGRGQAVSAGGRRRPGRFHGLSGGGPRSGARATPEHGQLVRRAVRPDRLRRGACAPLHGEHGAPAARPAGQSQERIAASETMTVAPGMVGRIDAAFSAENRQATPKTLRNGSEFEKICIRFDDGF